MRTNKTRVTMVRHNQNTCNMQGCPVEMQHLRNKDMSFIGPHDVPVAKATVLSTNLITVVGGTPLGAQCCEVVVNLVLKRNATLLRPYGNMSIMADALGRSIAWPLQHMKEDSKSPQQRANHIQGRTHGGR